MPNNIVFNNVAQELKTQIYGSDTTSAIQTDANGKLYINTVDAVTTVTEVSNVTSVDTVDAVTTVTEVSNVTSVDAVTTVTEVSNVTSVDTVDAVTTVTEVSNVASVDTVDAVTTVTEVSNVTSVDTVDAVTTVTEVSNVASVDTIDALTEITNTVNVSTVDHLFEDDSTSFTDLDASTVCLQKDTSAKSMYSYYIKNTGSADVTAKLQISPTTTESYFIDDAATAVTISAGAGEVLIPIKYLNYTRLQLNPADTTTVEVYYNAQA